MKINNNKFPKISVVVPSFNQGQFLEYCLNSIISQGYPNLELIVMDGGSTDNSVEILNKYNKNITYWVSENDKGQSDAVNRGLAIATGSIIGWLNSDDIYLNNCLYSAIEFFKDNPNCGIVFSNYYFIDEESKIIRRRKEIPFNYGIYLWTNGCYHANCAGFFRSSVFNKIGYLDETLDYGMDYEFYLRASQQGIDIKHSNSYWAGYRFHKSSKSISSSDLQEEESNKIVMRYFPKGISSTKIKILKIIYRYFRYIRKLFIGSYLPFNKLKHSLHNNFKDIK